MIVNELIGIFLSVQKNGAKSKQSGRVPSERFDGKTLANVLVN